MAQARLSALKAQLQPHFLFNTLNAIVVLVRQQKGQQAEETLARFSDLLRAVLADMDAQEVTLARELEYLRLYLSIEQLRFSDRLRVDIDVDPELLDAAVPHMALQPIVENAIRHGIGARASSGLIEIRAQRIVDHQGDHLHVSVRDDGPGFREKCTSGGLGLGLANTRARLKQLYGAEAELTTESPRGRRRRRDPGAALSRKRNECAHECTHRRRRTAGARRHAAAAEGGARRSPPSPKRAMAPRPCAMIRERRPDLVFLDVQMPELDGFGVLRAVGAEHMPPVIFVTAHDRYAIQAFEVNAIDYLLKPVTRERCSQALARVRERIDRRAPTTSTCFRCCSSSPRRRNTWRAWRCARRAGFPS